MNASEKNGGSFFRLFQNAIGNGNLYDERCRYDFINGAPFSFIIEDNPIMSDDGNFRLQYYLNGETQLSESLYLECDINLEERKKRFNIVKMF